MEYNAPQLPDGTCDIDAAMEYHKNKQLGRWSIVYTPIPLEDVIFNDDIKNAGGFYPYMNNPILRSYNTYTKVNNQPAIICELEVQDYPCYKNCGEIKRYAFLTSVFTPKITYSH